MESGLAFKIAGIGIGIGDLGLADVCFGMEAGPVSICQLMVGGSIRSWLASSAFL